jgi:ABC-type branched-subunit amino acid transport system substrate-binding protein
MDVERNRVSAVAALLAMLILAAACGQKPGVANKIEGVASGAIGGLSLPEGSTVDEEGNIIDAEGNVIGNVEEGITDPALASGGAGGSGGGVSTSTGTSGGGSSSSTGSGSGGGSGTGSGGSGGPPGGAVRGRSNATGVSANKITYGIHAPLSGAAPVPSDSVQKGKDLYFRWLARNNKSIGGRNVEVVLKNDQYNPSTAVAVCKEMVQQDKVFLLSGAAGTDQIAACARYSESVGVPYISAGVTEQQVNTFRTYFATSMTYPDQAPLLVDLMTSKLGAKREKNAMLFFNTASFADAANAFKAAAARAGMRIHIDKRVSKNAGTAEARQAVQEFTLAGINNVYVLTSPVFWINVLKQANTQAFRPQWVGVGISMTFDTVVTAACPDGSSIDKAKFFSPFPAWVDSNKFDPNFQKAVRALNDEECGSAGCGDDFMWLSWLGSRTIADMFLKTGRNLTRGGFVEAVESMRGYRNGIGPELNFSSNSHFGARQVHVNEARCSDRRWHTLYPFRSSF